MVEKSSVVKRSMDELKHSISLATKEKQEMEEENRRRMNDIKKTMNLVGRLEKEANTIHEQHIRSTQAEESETEEKLKKLQVEVDDAKSMLSRLKEEDNALIEQISVGMNEIARITELIADHEKRQREINTRIHELQQHKTNKVIAFGGERVINLLRAIERHHKRFYRPPIGPIGAHLRLIKGDTWAPAAEQADRKSVV